MMQLTERDIRILRLINELGCVDIEFIAERFEMKRNIAYRRLRMLTLENYLLRDTVLYKNPGAYRATSKGVEASLDPLPALKKLSLGVYRHNLLVAKLSTKLLRKYGGAFITERQLRHDSGFSGVGVQKHLCDGVLELTDKKIAIEVELSPKGKRRLDGIIRQYRRDLAYQEVWYFCGTREVKNKVAKSIAGINFIKLFDLNEYVKL